MPAGLTIYNQDNIIQIDDKYQNIFLINKSVTKGIVKAVSVDYPRQRMDSLIAVSITPRVKDQMPIAGGNDYYAGNYYEYADVSYKSVTVGISPNMEGDILSVSVGGINDNFPDIVAAGGFTLSIYEFGVLEQTTARAGLQVFSPTGKLVFDAAYKPLKIGDFIRLPAAVMQWYDRHDGSMIQRVRGWALTTKPYKDVKKQYAMAFLNDTFVYGATFLSSSSGYYNSGGWSAYTKVGFHETFYKIIQERARADYEEVSERDGMVSFSREVQFMLLDVTNY